MPPEASTSRGPISFANGSDREHLVQATSPPAETPARSRRTDTGRGRFAVRTASSHPGPVSWWNHSCDTTSTPMEGSDIRCDFLTRDEGRHPTDTNILPSLCPPSP
ncbi:hypothetical protein GCM10010384_54620 [Streptomyces djakartensis]|uniref:Uncharacterized protein n=1 Tax=Streptomyces djakartensis TaxID=68193 RepID=A0ABQ3A914_9ACTN|nr:hypothetical protein GCM10010384_54620 [Streptomyces djakartensis]